MYILIKPKLATRTSFFSHLFSNIMLLIFQNVFGAKGREKVAFPSLFWNIWCLLLLGIKNSIASWRGAGSGTMTHFHFQIDTKPSPSISERILLPHQIHIKKLRVRTQILDPECAQRMHKVSKTEGFQASHLGSWLALRIIGTEDVVCRIDY